MVSHRKTVLNVSSFMIFIVIIITAVTPVEAAPHRTVLHVGTKPGYYSTIQAAVDVATDGDTILVHAGTYRESVRIIGKSIIVKGEHAIVDPPNPGGSFQNGFHIKADKVTIEGFQIIGANPGIGIVVIGDKNELHRNKVSNNLIGIMVTGKDNDIHHNKVNNNLFVGIVIVGIEGTITTNKNNVHENEANNNGLIGIVIASNSNEIDHNEANKNGQYGIVVTGNYNKIHHNKAKGNGVLDLADYGVGNIWSKNKYKTANF